jgi:alanyl-tRNA synthetase
MTRRLNWVDDSPAPEGPYSKEDFLRDDEAGKWLEIWNDVFIQSEWQGEPVDPARPDKGWKKTGMPDLPFKSVDTGMGLDRTAAALGGHRSVYDTDAFQPIFRELEKLGSGFKYGSSEDVMQAMRIVADHVRGAIFCIADGILPGNSGRGYVLRRLIRRAVLKGQRGLGFDSEFLYRLVDVISAPLQSHYPELADRHELVIETLKGEEHQFRTTLGRGSSILAKELKRIGTGAEVSGSFAFQLYDTYGFPVEVTEEIAAEQGCEVDIEGFRAAMIEAQERSRGASGMETVYGGVEGTELFGGRDIPATEFIGYTDREAEVTIVAVQPRVDPRGNKTNKFVAALDRSPFYAESGGQCGDTGTLTVDGQTLKVLDTQKNGGIWLHIVETENGLEPKSIEGKMAEARVDNDRLTEVTRNHTATHLMHAALRQVLGGHVAQAGSLVNSESLRFDFTHSQAMTPAEIAEVEALVNKEIWAAQPVTIHDGLEIDEARSIGAMALFGEKYADKVRVVQIGDMPKSEPSFSRELCGGIHVKNTGEIGVFKVISEASAASGVRRITAFTGQGAVNWANQQQSTVAEAAGKLKATPRDLLTAIDKTLANLKEEKKKREQLASQGSSSAAESTEIGSVTLVVSQLQDVEMKDAQAAADRAVDGKADHVGLVALAANGKVMFVCKAGDDAVKAGAHAGNIVKAAASAAGGGGGGRPNFATAGAKDSSKLPAAIEAAKAALTEQVGA